MSDYPNRSDLRNPATRRVNFTGQTYGEATQQARVQTAVPPGTAPAQVQAQQIAAEARPKPGAQAFTRPTERPNEPVTSGIPIGPGPNTYDSSVVPPGIVPDDPVLDKLMMLYAAYPEDGLRVFLSRYWNVNA
jgi:hypothetical protein